MAATKKLRFDCFHQAHFQGESRAFFKRLFVPIPSNAPHKRTFEEKEREEEEQEEYEIDTEENASENDEDSETIDQAEFVLTDEAIVFLASSVARRKQRDEQRQKAEQDEKIKHNKANEARVAETLAATEHRRELYGEEAFTHIQHLEDQINAHFNRAVSKYKPVLWPELPLRYL